MRILISGGSGFIGKYVTDELSCQHEVFVVGTRENIKTTKSFSGKEIPYYYSDYTQKSLEIIISEVKPEAVINLAAQRPIGNQNSISDFYKNLEISANIYEVCLRSNVLNIVDTSTRMIYTQENTRPWIETEFVNPNNYYALSKLWIEQAAMHFNKKGLRIKILRLAQVIGLGEKEGFVLQTYLKNAMEGTPITTFGKDIGKRHYIYVKDVVGAIKAAMDKPELGGIFNIGMTDIYSFKDLAVAINSIFGNKSEIIGNPDAKADENIYQMSIEKARRELKWQPQYDLYETYTNIKSDIEKNAGL